MARHPGQTASLGNGNARDGARSGDDENGGDQDAARSVMLANVARDARLDRKFVLLVTLSTALATLGLLQGSAAVVIGAMLVSPFLGPIMGLGFGLATLDSSLIRRALSTLAVGVAAAVLLAMILVWLSPVEDVTAEVRARTQPTLLDLGVAVVGGIAGVYAILRRLSGVMVGVAIATALVPPLCTIGFGLATGRPGFAIGAALLFLTNTLAIAFSATLVARLNRFGPALTPKHTAMQVVSILAALGVLSVPLAVSLQKIAREIAVRTTVQAALSDILGPDDRVDTLTIALEDGKVRVDGVILVGRYRADLAGALMRSAAPDVARPMEVKLVQLRQQTTSSQVQDALDRRITALEQRERETARLLNVLTADGAIPRSAITLDAAARRIWIALPPTGTSDPEATSANNAIATARATYPGWSVVTVFVPEPQVR